MKPAVLLLAMLLIAVPAYAGMNDGLGKKAPADILTPPSPARGWAPVDVFAGPSILNSQVGISVGMRYPLKGKWAWEAGAVVPHPVNDYAEEKSFTPGGSLNESVTAGVRSYGEIHLIGLYTVAEKPRLSLDAGVGVSLGIIHNHYEIANTPNPGPGTASIVGRDSHRVLPAPRVQVVLRGAITKRLSARLGIGYVYYSNTDGLDTRSYGLSFGGAVIEPGVVWVF